MGGVMRVTKVSCQKRFLSSHYLLGCYDLFEVQWCLLAKERDFSLVSVQYWLCEQCDELTKKHHHYCGCQVTEVSQAITRPSVVENRQKPENVFQIKKSQQLDDDSRKSAPPFLGTLPPKRIELDFRIVIP